MDKLDRKSIVLIITTFGNFITPLMLSSVNIALPTIGSEFNVDGVSLNWVPTAYVLATSVFMVPFGRLSDMYGKARVYLTGMSIHVFSNLLCATAQTFPMLIIGRMVQGICTSMVVGVGPALLTVVYPPEQRGRVLGINTAAVYVGMSVGPIFGGMLVERFGWRSIFWCVIPLYFVSAIAATQLLKNDLKESRGEKFDIAGAVLYSLGMVLFVIGLSEMPRMIAVVLTVAGAAIFCGFIYLETRTKYPVLDVGLFKNNRMFVFSNLAALINYCATSSIALQLSLYLQYTKSLSPFIAGLVLFVQPLVQAVLSPFAGKLSDRYTPGRVASTGMIITCTGILLLVVETFVSQTALVVVSLVVLGFGFALFSAPNMHAIMSSVEKNRLGVASSFTATMRSIGQVLSLAIVMFIFSVVIGKVEITPEVYGSFLISIRIILLILAALCAGGVFASLARNPKPEEKLNT